MTPSIVEVKDPLKQGLKLDNIIDMAFYFLPVEVKDPLKQGLKPYILCYVLSTRILLK